MLRFALVKYGNTQSILVSTCLELTPEAIIRLYSCRFRIEGSSANSSSRLAVLAIIFGLAPCQNSTISGKRSSDPLDKIYNDELRAAVRAVEGFVMFSCIAMGLLQMIALQYSDTLELQSFRYLRTQSSFIASEGTTMCFLRRFFSFYGSVP